MSKTDGPDANDALTLARSILADIEQYNDHQMRVTTLAIHLLKIDLAGFERGSSEMLAQCHETLVAEMLNKAGGS